MSGYPPSPELLAPAGNWECARAAVANGADAIYFGLPAFNARLRADNFSNEDLPELMDWLHRHGARGFVAMNTLVFTGELVDAARQLEGIAAAKVDALIIQDPGLAMLARRIAPEVELHASTQMTITSPEGLRFAHRLLGLDRAVLARELSLRELRRFQTAASETGIEGADVPLEVFVHGALCVAYSGQCLTSEALGRRSANRGECAQACRMPYTLEVDGMPLDLGNRRHLLSPQDLAAHDEIGGLLDLGVVSFKIEGRLKSPEYVAAVTAVYRKAIDAARAGKNPASELTPADRYSLEMTFSRGLTGGWLRGPNHPALVHGRFGKKRGPYLGTVTSVGRDWVELDRTPLAKPGDGIVFDTGGDTNQETGGYLDSVRGSRIFLAPEKIDASGVRAGHHVWKTSDPVLIKSLRETWKGRLPEAAKTAVHLVVRGRVGECLEVTEPTRGITVRSSLPLQAAERRPMDLATLERQLGRMGGTAYELTWLELRLDGDVILPLSELNAMRRELVAALQQADTPPRKPALSAAAALAELLPDRNPTTPEWEQSTPSLSVLVRNPQQLEAALETGIGIIHVDYEDIRLMGGAVERVREHAQSQSSAGSAPAVFLATPRIQKPGEAGYFKLLQRARPDGILIRNLGALDYFSQRPELRRIGDFSLNAANPITASLLRESAALERLTISYDLNAAQVLELAAATPPDWLELVLHQHMPMFHMEHCVFCTFMSNGTDFTNCGRPCEKHRVDMVDRVGMKHPLIADVGCRNTLFRGQAQTGAAYLPEMLAAGLRQFRIELLRQSKPEATRLISLYQDLLAGRRSPADTRRLANATSQMGVTEGTLR